MDEDVRHTRTRKLLAELDGKIATALAKYKVGDSVFILQTHEGCKIKSARVGSVWRTNGTFAYSLTDCDGYNISPSYWYEKAVFPTTEELEQFYFNIDQKKEAK